MPNRMQMPKLKKSGSKHLDPKIYHIYQFLQLFKHIPRSNLKFRILSFQQKRFQSIWSCKLKVMTVWSGMVKLLKNML